MKWLRALFANLSDYLFLDPDEAFLRDAVDYSDLEYRLRLLQRRKSYGYDRMY